ncbi:hypothetical protein [Geopseudomonas aromaticivorans]
MSVIQCDYLPDRQPEPIPLPLAARIARAAAAEGERIERQTIGQATREALEVLPPDTSPALIARLIAHRAVTLADRAEDRAIEELVTAARRHLRTGLDVGEVARLLGL